MVTVNLQQLKFTLSPGSPDSPVDPGAPLKPLMPGSPLFPFSLYWVQLEPASEI